MLKKRLIPKLQLSVKDSFRGKQSVLVVTRQFGSRRAIGNPLSQAKIYESQMADELILVNLEQTAESWSTMLKTVEELAEELATPLSVGGGLKNIEQIQALLDRGADKIVLNSGAINEPNLINRVAKTYGAQCVVVSIDVRQKNEDRWGVWAMNGKIDTKKNALDWACEATDRGAGEVLVTAIDRDGTGQGLDLGITSCLTGALNVPVITSGGCGLAQHFVEGYQAGASAVAAGTFFCQRDQNPMQCRSHIRNAGLPIRLEV